MGLHFKQLLCLVPCVVHTTGGGKKLITPTDGCPIQRKCQKDSHDSHSTCERAQHGEHDGFTDGCMCREMMESPSQMPLSSYFQGQNHLCVLKQLCAPLSHLLRIFIFAVIKYRRIQNKHFSLFEMKCFFKSEKTLEGEQIKRSGRVYPTLH